MRLNSDIFHPSFEEILILVHQEASALNIDFYLAGAVARDYHLSKTGDYVPSRKTADIDIAVMVANEEEFCKLKDNLIKTSYFEAHKEPIKLIYKKTIELDLLPYGSIEERGVTYLTKPKSFVLEMPGFTLLNEYTEEILLNPKFQTRVCSLEGIVLLKLIANNDRPERTKDLTDIQLIIDLYFDIVTEDIYTNHFDLMEKYDTKDNVYKQKICAHVIGRKLKSILKGDMILLQRIKKILEQDKDNFWSNVLNGLIE